LGRDPHNYRYCVYRIEDKATIIEESHGERDATYDEMADSLPDDECRYALIDIEFTTEDGRETSKMLFISWFLNPEVYQEYTKT